MAFKAPASREGKAFKLPPAGTHPARLIRLIDVGTHANTYEGRTNFQRKILVVWEIPSEMTDDGEPLTINKEFTFSMGDKAKLRQMIVQLTGKDPKDDFDLESILNKECLINVGHKVSSGGKTYANVVSVSPVPKGMKVPTPTNLPFALHLDDFAQELYDKLSDYIKEKIRQSPEGQKALNIHFVDGQSNQTFEEDIPF